MKYWLVTDNKSGEYSTIITQDDETPGDVGIATRGVLIEEIERAPEPYEHWSPTLKTWVMDRKAKADAETGQATIDRARMMKAMEARLIASGVTLAGGYLQREAEARAMTVAEVASLVLEKVDADVEKEITRIAAGLVN